MKTRLLSLITTLCFTTISGFSQVKLPQIFGDQMVLQRNKPIPVWGTASPDEKVTVTLVSTDLKSSVKSAKAGKDGKWKVNLDQMEAGGPFQMIVKGKKNELTLKDILIGEVWICSGQSNMGWTVNASNDPELERKNANYPEIRHFQVPHYMATSPQENLPSGDWKLTTPENVGNFTAVGYFFGRELYNELKVPIGLINTSWGGTHVETWISKEGMQTFGEFTDAVNKIPATLEEVNDRKYNSQVEAVKSEQGSFPSSTEANQFIGVDFDHSTWKELSLPRYFDSGKYPSMDGVVWFRKEVIIPQSAQGSSLILSLGIVNDKDETYFNGVKIGGGETTGERQYSIPANLVKAGKNVITVRVEDKGGQGGFGGKAERMFLVSEKGHINLDGDWKYRVESLVNNKQYNSPNDAGTLLYNSMIHPLIPFAFRGAIWYQGESNAGRAYQYRKSFPLMITDWRKKWSEDFPFYFVQLASFDASGGNTQKGSTWAELREAQTMTLSLPNTGMAVTSDIGESKDIHPRNKQDVGKRLALNALNKVYGKDVVYAGPTYKSMKKQANAIVLSFDHVHSGFDVKDKYRYIKGFEIAGPDKKFYWAKAEIDGDNIVVYSDDVEDPIAVRYGWSDDNIEPNVFNKEGLPMGAFRTDDWPGITEKNKF